LDRKTGGVLLFALEEEIHKKTQQLFAQNQVQKQYLAIVRGFTEDAVEIDYPLRKDNGSLQDAYTSFKTLTRAELPVPFGRYQTSRYSLLRVQPKTGRMHQIRKHLSHIRHPIIGDRPHGCNKQNKFFKERWQIDTMLLHAFKLEFIHPLSNEAVTIQASLQSEFRRMMTLMHWETHIDK
jgi:tRNA pseudouridine65 synthase